MANQRKERPGESFEKKQLTDEKKNKNPSNDKKTKSRSNENAKKAERIDPVPESTRFMNQMAPYIFFVSALLITAFFLLSKVDGAVGSLGIFMRDFFCGSLGWSAFIIPLLLINLAVFWRKYVDLAIVKPKLWLSFGCIISISSLVHVFYIPAIYEKSYAWGDWGASIFGIGEPLSNWTYGIRLQGGGFIGGLLGGLFRCAVGYVGAIIFLCAVIFLFVLFLVGITPGYFLDLVKFKLKQKREASSEKREAHAENREAIRAERREKLAEERRLAALEAQVKREEREAQLKARREAIAIQNIEKEATPNKSSNVDDFLPEFRPSDADTEPEPQIVAPMPDDPEPISPPQIIITPEKSKAAEPQVKTLEPVRQNTSSDDPYGLKEIFKDPEVQEVISGTIECETGATGFADTAGKAESPDRSTASDDLEIKLTPIDDTAENEANALSPEQLEVKEEEPKEKKRPSEYPYPPSTLLKPSVQPKNEDIETELRTNAQKLMETLSSFNVKIKKIEFSRGPTITRYELYPEAGTRIRSIASLVDDIALSLATSGVRIEAPIPNKSAVGVEVPNRVRTTVFIRELLESEKFTSSESKLTACLGKDVAGNMIIFDIAKMPHLLVAGTTGSGKSVCINCIVMSLLFKARPDELQFIMIDPKKIEMGMYSNLPHLKVPVVTDMKKAAGTLIATVNEMTARYSTFERIGVRDIDDYNAITVGDPDLPPMPKLVVVIDELADLMMSAPGQVEDSICHLAQMGRASGIHLIVGTQRPSVDVVTGLIKANIPSRIAFTVASQVDSRTIIDISGAEKLIGKGDMLYAPIGALKPKRAQGAMVSTSEVEAVTDFIKKSFGCAEYDCDFIDDIDRATESVSQGKKGGASSGGGDISTTSDGGMFKKALKVAVDNGTIATSYLQRTLAIGYGRAARLIDQMEKLGFVSPANGTKPRTVLLTPLQYSEMDSRGDTRLEGIVVESEENLQ